MPPLLFILSMCSGN